MSDIARWKVSGPATRLQPDANGPWVALVDYYRVIDRLIAERDAAQVEVERLKNAIDHLTSERDEAQAEVERLTAERDAAQAEVERLRAERDQMATHPRGREVGRFGLDGHYLDAMEPTRPTDEDIWREGFKRQVAEYRKRWSR